ncbi:MAG: redoxin domain-containing protein [Bacteroidales bacterium]|nr:redoxin domain-containing protein [Candidatus Scybalousia scybalohippi]
MKRILFFCIIYCLDIVCSAQNVYITGSSKEIKGKTVKLYSITDGVSGSEKEEQIVKLSDEDTSFSFAITLSGEKQVLMKIDLMRYSFVAKPGTKYHLNIKEFNFSQDDSLFGYAYGLALPAELTMERFDGINLPMNDVDNYINAFLYDSHRLLFVKDKQTLEAFYQLRDSLIDAYKDNEYISNYIKYEFASIDYGLNLKSRRAMKDSLFAHQPILYDNIGYMDCFQNVFSKYFSKGYKYIKRSDIEQWLASNNYNAFNDALGRDRVLENEVFRELVFLQGMKDAYLDGYFNRDLVKNMLEKFSNTTKFAQHKEIAENLILSLSNINAENTDIKDLKVKDVDGNIRSLNEYITGKPLIVSFVRLDQELSLKELEAIHFCYDSIKDNCNVLTICCSNSYERMFNFIKNNKVGNKYKWDFVYFDNNYDVVEAFHVRTFPTFVLVGKDGKIEKNPMNSPTSGAFLTFKTKK